MPNTSFFKNDDRYKPIRKMFGKNEYVYIMDAKKSGNVGRYFNVRMNLLFFFRNFKFNFNFFFL